MLTLEFLREIKKRIDELETKIQIYVYDNKNMDELQIKLLIEYYTQLNQLRCQYQYNLFFI